jgi:circadian clock protein KaiB
MTRQKREGKASGKRAARPAARSVTYVLKLYVTGATETSFRAITNVKSICEQYLKGQYDLEITDIHQRSVDLRADQVVAVPALVRRQPTPFRVMVGDFSKTDKVLRGLGLVVTAS